MVKGSASTNDDPRRADRIAEMAIPTYESGELPFDHCTLRACSADTLACAAAPGRHGYRWQARGAAASLKAVSRGEGAHALE